MNVANSMNAKPGQIALSWLLQKGDFVVPIPGTTRRTHLEENIAAISIGLTKGDMAMLDECLTPDKIAGNRYADWIMETIDR
jgi:diketogulonate reductase-like aldo/keto reductase